MKDERVVLSKTEAIEMLPDTEKIHTFRQCGPMLLGADWDKENIIETINNHDVEITGEQAQSMGHGIALHDDKGWLFIETKK